MNIIFLDIDGVLNSDEFFDEERNKIIKKFNEEKFENKHIGAIDDFDLLVDYAMLHIDINKLEMVKELSKEINYDVVIISSWRENPYYDFIEERLKELGLPIVGRIDDKIVSEHESYTVITYDRGMVIRDYISSNNVNNYVILDDETRDYDDKQLKKLVQTNYKIGISTNDVDKVKKMCQRRRVYER